MKKNIVALTLLSTIASCGSSYHRPESIESKMARYESKKLVVNKVPNFEIKNIKITPSRMPASSTQAETAYSNRSVYFLSLYDQYISLGEVFPSYKEKISTCPTFHQEMLKKDPRKYSYSIKENIDFTNESITTSLGTNKSELMSNVKSYMETTRNEIVELCTRGYSDNYYIYENLVTLSGKKGVLSKDQATLNAYLKTTILYNDLLLSKISTKSKHRSSGRTIASNIEAVDYTQEAINRIKASWATDLLK